METNEANIEQVLCGPEGARDYYGELIPMYQRAFAGPPWFEQSKCRGDGAVAGACKDGLSPLPVGGHCVDCDLRTTQPAHEPNEVIAAFDGIASQAETAWYIERVSGLAAVAIVASKIVAKTVSSEILTQGDDRFEAWSQRHLGPAPFGWIHEVFANPEVRSQGNLQNFQHACLQLAEKLRVNRLAYSTINPRMIRAGSRFGDRAQHFVADKTVPYWLDFVIIDV